ncbi:hypothetical protein Fcan01_11865 [Folsomia candida]|uniref:Uncharacterized protein n=1 Tax=Folsomia candida TaxID=158441 RepID=A0A226EBB0_FOLCA|nr:hypothetical protein Fcan01_11865 [Folsomia candida]
MHYISRLFDDSIDVPDTVRTTLFFKIMLAVWAPVAILLTNCYIGLMISELNAPWKGAHPEFFEGLICDKSPLKILKGIAMSANEWKRLVEFDKLVQNSDRNRYNNWDTRIVHDRDCFTFISLRSDNSPPYWYNTPLYIRTLETRTLFQFLPHLMSNPVKKSEIIEFLLGDPLYHYLGSRQSVRVRRQANFDNAFPYHKKTRDKKHQFNISPSECKKTAYISEVYRIDAKLQHLQRKFRETKYFKGKDLLHQKMEGFAFRAGGRSAVPRNFDSLYEAGIIGRLKVESISRLATSDFDDHDTEKQDPKQDFKPMSLDGENKIL